MTKCRLCANPQIEQWQEIRGKIYHYCSQCGIIQLDQTHFLSPEEEQERYLRHNNTMKNKGYVTYLSNFIDKAVIPYVIQGGNILDFGSGPASVLSELLTARGFPTQSYDPFFNDTGNWENILYDAVVAVEVFEHLHYPGNVIPRIQKSLKTKGHLILRTLLHNEDHEAFINWWYKDDSTHVSFYSKKTIDHICAKWNFTPKRIDTSCEITLKKK